MGLSQTGDLGPFTIYTDKRRQPVWFLKAPPTKTPSALQLHNRNRFRNAANAWRHLTPATRALWAEAAHKARLFASGYNVFIYWQLRRDAPPIHTIERLSGITLI